MNADPNAGRTLLAPDAFAGTTALVLGASRGIGAETARAFARHGADVVLASRDRPALERVRAQIVGTGGRAVVCPVDLEAPARVAELGRFLREEVGGLDVAFNNVGEGLRPRPLAEIEPGEFERVLRVGVQGFYLALREEIPLLLARGGGAIVNMSSTAGLSAFAGGAAYVTAKHAVIGLTKSAALDYAPRGIRVNAVAPGPIETDRLLSLPGAERDRARQAVPSRRLGQPKEVAEVVLWLCSASASFVTGTTVVIDGGRMAGFA